MRFPQFSLACSKKSCSYFPVVHRRSSLLSSYPNYHDNTAPFVQRPSTFRRKVRRKPQLNPKTRFCKGFRLFSCSLSLCPLPPSSLFANFSSSFSFFTDIHHGYLQRLSPQALRLRREACLLPCVEPPLNKKRRKRKKKKICFRAGRECDTCFRKPVLDWEKKRENSTPFVCCSLNSFFHHGHTF